MLSILAKATAGKFSPTTRWISSKVNRTPLLPSTLTDITASWICGVLHDSEAIPAAVAVEAVTVVPCDFGKTSTVARVAITYANADGHPDLPASVMVKLSRTDLKGRVMGLAVRLYRECFFYEHIGPDSGLPIPRCYFSYANSFTGEFVLVLEEVRPASTIEVADEAAVCYRSVPSDETSGVDVAMVEAAIDAISAMHVKYLNDSSLLDKWWIYGTASVKARRSLSEIDATVSYIEQQWKATRAGAAAGKFVGSPWADDFVAGMDRYVEHFGKLLGDRIKSECYFPVTLCHGDYHGQNILRMTDDGGDGRSRDSLVILDFQVLMVDEPQVDIGYLMGMGLTPSDRRAHDERLVRRSYDALEPALREQGDHAMPFELYFDRYKFCAMLKVFILVTLLDSLMADGRETDAYVANQLYCRAFGLMKDYGDPVDLAAKSAQWRRDLVAEKGEAPAI